MDQIRGVSELNFWIMALTYEKIFSKIYCKWSYIFYNIFVIGEEFVQSNWWALKATKKYKNLLCTMYPDKKGHLFKNIE